MRRLKPDRCELAMLVSDLHLENINTDVKLIRRDLDRAVELDASLYINGDLFEAVNIKDKRYDPSNVIPRLRGRKDMFTAALDYAQEFLEPYRDILCGIGIGNHEAHSTTHTGHDLSLELVKRMYRTEDMYMGYCGVIKLGNPGRAMYYHHGSGKGSSPRSTIDALYRMQHVRADVYCRGHSHVKLAWSEQRTDAVTGKSKEVWFISTGAYMRPYAVRRNVFTKGRQGNYAADDGMVPGGLGGVLVRFDTDRVHVEL